MKQVFSDISQVAHLWANQLQEHARNSGNFYFNGKTIYSYGSHFPIAKHVVNDKGMTGVLFTERTYSNTTAKHIAVVRQAASHKNIIYCNSPEATHEDNFKAWTRQAEVIAANLLKARKPEKYLSELGYIRNKVEHYAAFFSLAVPDKLVEAMNVGNKEQYNEYIGKKEQFEKAEQLKAQKELEKRHKKELKKWLAGERHRLYARNGFDYLRLSDNRIETTQAVQIPLEIGKRIWQQIKSNTLTVGAKVMDYEVAEVGKTIKIGCHNFKTDYLLKFGEANFK